jgi:nitrogen-specific signal transduction histidine kinase
VRTEIAPHPADTEVAERPGALPAQVLDTLEMGVVALDRERRVVYANGRIEELLGVEDGALLSLPGNRVFPGADARWLKGASRESRDFRIEAGDRDLTLRGESIPMRDEDGAVTGSVIVAEAISETEDGEFQKKIDRLVSLGELSAYVAHEIRNPLTGIRTTVQFVASKFKARDCATRGFERRSSAEIEPHRADHHRAARCSPGRRRRGRRPATCIRCSIVRSICSTSSSATPR